MLSPTRKTTPSSAVLAVECGTVKGAVFHVDRFVYPGGKSACIFFPPHGWITPIQLEEKAGLGHSKNWKRSVRYQGKPITHWIRENHRQICPFTHCSSSCAWGRNTPVTSPVTPTMPGAAVTPAAAAPSTPTSGRAGSSGLTPRRLLKKSPPPPPKPSVAANAAAAATTTNVAGTTDNDSDSGVSCESYSKALKIDVGVVGDVDGSQTNSTLPASPSPTAPPAAVLDYHTMIQEALLSLSSSGSPSTSQGCSQMNILLYILHHYQPADDVASVNAKVKNALNFLTRMDIVQRSYLGGTPESGDEEEADDDYVGSADGQFPRLSALRSPEKSPPAATPLLPLSIDTSKVKAKPKATQPLLTVTSSHNNRLSKPKVSLKLKMKAKAPNKAGPSAVSKLNKKKKKTKDGAGVVLKKEYNFKPKTLSPALSAICGVDRLSRPDVLKHLWLYIKAKQLQDPKERTIIVCDDKLRAVTKKKRIAQTDMLKSLKNHLFEIPDAGKTGETAVPGAGKTKKGNKD